MTEAVPLGELLHEEALFVLTGVRKVGVPRGRFFPSGLCLSAISRVVWAWPDPLPTRLKQVGNGLEKCTDPMVGGARSITLYDACTPSSGPLELSRVADPFPFYCTEEGKGQAHCHRAPVLAFTQVG